MPKKAPTILVLDGSEEDRILIQHALGNVVNVLAAKTTGEAEDLFMAHQKKISLVAIDGNLQPGAAKLVSFIRKRYTGKMVATSDYGETNKALVAEGCDCACRKEDLPSLARKILGL